MSKERATLKNKIVTEGGLLQEARKKETKKKKVL